MQPVKKLLIGLDLGTTGLKGVLTDTHGNVLAAETVETDLSEPRPGWVELDPKAHFARICGVIKKLADNAQGDIAAVAAAGATGNTLLTSSSGEPLTPVINWMDQRCRNKPPSALKGLSARDVAAVAGWPCIETFPLAHLAWLKDNLPRVYSAAGHCGMFADWLIFRLSGRWLLDYSSATTFHLQNQLSRTYHRPFLERLALSTEKLPELLGSGVKAGTLLPECSAQTGLSKTTQVVTGCFDHPAAARAAGVLQPGRLMLSCGTSWVGFMPHDDRGELINAGLLCDPFTSGEDDGVWGGIFSVPCIGRNIQWYIDNQVAPGEADQMRIFNESADRAAPGAGGLTIDLSAEPAHVNGSRANISRAVMESAAKLLKEKIIVLRRCGFRYDKAVLVGGPAESPVWPRIIADITGLELSVSSRHAGARGAAMLAGIGAGIYHNEQHALSLREVNNDC